MADYFPVYSAKKEKKIDQRSESKFPWMICNIEMKELSVDICTFKKGHYKSLVCDKIDNFNCFKDNAWDENQDKWFMGTTCSMHWR